MFEVVQYKQLNPMQRNEFSYYVMNNEVKACRVLVPWLKESRKKKIMTFLMCLRKALSKDILWMIIDMAYSPINER